MVANLSELCDDASPTPFHRALTMLHHRGKLARVYTQNIDGLEGKAGLSVVDGMVAIDYKPTVSS
jgi:NAD-dependent histone deacetylase SIR2